MASDFISNPYVEELCQSLKEAGISVDSGLEKFWIKNKDYDIVHIQWPEGLFGWREIIWNDVRSLFSDVLKEWKSSSRIIITRHNEDTHIRTNKHWQYICEHIYDHVDGVIHLGDWGLEEFKTKHADNIRMHCTIPHPIYHAYGELNDASVARSKLGISNRRKVVLAFGALRHWEERDFFQKAFFLTNVKGKLLLAPSFGQCIRPRRKNWPSWLLWEIKNREIIPPRKFQLGKHQVADGEVCNYFSAADIVIIPRLHTLNSGLIPLAFQFKKVVVGPQVGNIGRILINTGNPTFDVSSTRSAADAIEEAFRLVDSGQGLKNYNYAKENWARDIVADMHKRFYESVLRDSN